MFELVSKHQLTDDQQRCSDFIVDGLKNNKRYQILKGATGTGKTLMMADIIRKSNKPTLIITQNKTLVGQIYQEMKALFPNNHVGYYVSYYDKFMPETYNPATDVHLDKEVRINPELDQLRHESIHNLLNYNDTIIVSSVSALWGIGEKSEYTEQKVTVAVGDDISILPGKLNRIGYKNVGNFERCSYSLEENYIVAVPPFEHSYYFKITFGYDNCIERIESFDIRTNVKLKNYRVYTFYPTNLSTTSEETRTKACESIRLELADQMVEFKKKHRDHVAKRLEKIVNGDIEKILSWGYCPGIENYSSHLQGDLGNHYTYTILDYFPEDFNIFIDESHITLQQLRCQGASDKARKTNLVEYGFRLPSCYENAPLTYEQFERRYKNIVYVSATPGKLELEQAGSNIVEQIIRPTGLLDPTIEVVYNNYIDNLLEQLQSVLERKEKVLITTLTCRMAEELTHYLKGLGYRTEFLDARNKTLDRLGLINKLSSDKADILVGVNLIREGISIPNASLMVIFDADKCGFLRSDKSLIQYIGRVARNVNGHVVMYATRMVGDMERAIEATNKRREIQEVYNKEHGIIPKNAEENRNVEDVSISFLEEMKKNRLTLTERKKLYAAMLEAAKETDFEKAIRYRDMLAEINAL